MSRLAPEEIAELAPDVILVTEAGFDLVGSAQKFSRLPGVAKTPAGKRARVFRVEESEVQYFGPRTPAFVRRLSALLRY
jgi:iron complex transport system substrate-binding protein